MTIEQIGIGAAPGDNTGDGLRTAMTKVNNNFSNTSHAASKLTGTAPENVPLNSNLGDSSTRNVGLSAGDVLSPEGAGLDGGETNWTSGNMQPELTSGLGVRVKLKNISGITIFNNQDVAGSLLAHFFISGSGLMVESLSTPIGTWRNVSDASVSDGNGADFTRIS